MGYVANNDAEEVGWVHEKKKVLEMIGTMKIKEKRGSQWDRSQIRVTMGPQYLCFTSTKLYFVLKNTLVKKHPNC